MPSTEVLVVDDEAMIAENLQYALEDAGYAVTIASSGHDAMTLVNSKAHDFRALVTDVNLPDDTTGWKIAHRARELHPKSRWSISQAGRAMSGAQAGFPKASC